MKHKNPFLGEIELTKVGETTKNLMGESRVDTVYTDSRQNYYIQTWTTTGGDPIPMVFLRKEVAALIAEIESRLNPTYEKSKNRKCYCGNPVDTTNPDCDHFNLCAEHASDS